MSYSVAFYQSCTIVKHFSMCFRDLWSEVGGNCAVWTPVWEQAGSYAGRAVCGFHSAVGPSGGGPVQAARTGQPGQRAAGCLRLWRETLFWLVRRHMSVLAAWISALLMWRWYVQAVDWSSSGNSWVLLLAWNKPLQMFTKRDLNDRGFQYLFSIIYFLSEQVISVKHVKYFTVHT